MRYDELIAALRFCDGGECDGCCRYKKEHGAECYTLLRDAADAIKELSRQRDRAYARLCEWCGVCPEGKRNPEDCEIAALNPEPPKEE